MRRFTAVLAAAALIEAPAAAGWTWPVDGPVLRPFAVGSDPYAAGQHRGIDIGAASGMTVHAAAAGTVSFAGTVPNGGRTVTVQTPGGLSVTYLELGATRVARGTEVAEGDPIGAVGSADHVHFGVRVTADAHGYLDPLQFLPPRAAAPARTDAPDLPAPVATQARPAAGDDPVQPPVAAESALRAKAEPAPAPKVKAEPELAPGPEPAQPVQAPPTAVPGPQRAAPSQPAVASAAADVSSLSREARGVRLERQPATGGGKRAEVSAQKRARLSRPPLSRSDPRGATAESGRPRGTTAQGLTRSVQVEPRPRVGTTNEKRAPAGRVVELKDRPEVVARPSGPAGEQQSRRLVRAALTGCLALVLLCIGAVVHRKRRPNESFRSASSIGQARCPLGRTRRPRLLHACARSREPECLMPGARRRRVVVSHRPLRRPERRAPVGAPA
jgi:Peptidase family M23